MTAVHTFSRVEREEGKEAEKKKICVEGRNCWRIVPARRAAFLVDGEAYFEACAAAFERAQKSICIVGWDIHSRVQLIRDGRERDLPTALGPLLSALVARRRGLHVYVLEWDFAIIYAFERELYPRFPCDWRTRRRLHFAWDDSHPLGGAHHQKIVVVDDAIAFAGGFDLSRSRWDTPAHLAGDPRRVDANGQPYPPFHDVQIAVDGEAAATLGYLVRERWRQATGRRLRALGSPGSDPWPPGLRPDVENAPIAIARTQPAYNGTREVREVEALYLDAIAAAQRYIYIENQYLTSAVIGDALAARLCEAKGPDIVLVLPTVASGWLEESTMGVLRARLLRRLRAADRFHRLRVYCPVVPGLVSWCIGVHAKIFVVDDCFARVGSANLSNRSMGLDTECDLALEARGKAHIAKAIRSFRNRLLGEHLGVDPEKVAEIVDSKGSLIAAVEALRGGERTLEPLEGTVPEWLDQLIPDSAVVDPERPVAPEKLMEQVVPSEDCRQGGRALLRSGILLLVLLGLAIAWRWTSLADWFAEEQFMPWVASLQGSATAPLVVAGLYFVGSLMLLPVTLLIVATAFAFGPWLGSIYSFVGCLFSAVCTYGIGAFLGRDTVQGMTGSLLNRLSQRIARHGLLAVIAVRMIPVAPFTVVNMVIGASHIRFRDFFWGTALGMSPGILALSLFEHRLEIATRQPGVANMLLLAGITVLLILAMAGIRRWLVKREPADASMGSETLNHEQPEV